MTDEQIRHMTNRFLGWKLPENFSPDDGISFEPIANKGSRYERRRYPVGTNLLDANQAEEMVRHIVEGLQDDERTRATCKRCRKILDAQETRSDSL